MVGVVVNSFYIAGLICLFLCWAEYKIYQQGRLLCPYISTWFKEVHGKSAVMWAWIAFVFTVTGSIFLTVLSG